MRHLLLTFIFAFSNVALAQQEAATPPVAVAAAMSRGAIVCSTAKINLTAKGVVLEDKSAGIHFKYTGGAKFTHKFIAKAITDGKFTVYGHLVELSDRPDAKSWFEMTEEIHGKEIYHTFKFSPVYRADGSIVKKAAKDGSLINETGKINVRCTNLPDVAEILPEYSPEEIAKLKSANTPN